MRIKLSPVAALPYDETRLVLVKSAGNHLSIDGELFNFNALNPGDEIPAGAIPSEKIVGPVQHIEGHVTLTVIYPIGAAPEPFQCFPEPIVADDDGPIDVPVDTRHVVEEKRVDGGTQVTTTRYVWRQAPAVKTEFIPDPPPPPEPELAIEEPANVEP